MHLRCRVSSSCDKIIWELLSCFSNMRGHSSEFSQLEICYFDDSHQCHHFTQEAWLVLADGSEADEDVTYSSKMKEKRYIPPCEGSITFMPLWDIQNKQEIKLWSGYYFSELSEPSLRRLLPGSESHKTTLRGAAVLLADPCSSSLTGFISLVYDLHFTAIIKHTQSDEELTFAVPLPDSTSGINKDLIRVQASSQEWWDWGQVMRKRDWDDVFKNIQKVLKSPLMKLTISYLLAGNVSLLAGVQLSVYRSKHFYWGLNLSPASFPEC